MKAAAKEHIDRLFERVPSLTPCIGDTVRACELLINCASRGGTVLACGNGGSASDAEHIVGELMNRFLLKRAIPSQHTTALTNIAGARGGEIAGRLQRAIRAISLVSQSALTTAVANDSHSDMVYAQQVYGYGSAGDVLIAISTSGNAPNVLAAAQVARALGLHVIGMTGQGGGALAPLCTTCIKVPSTITYQVQELHVGVYHALCAAVEHEMFGAG